MSAEITQEKAKEAFNELESFMIQRAQLREKFQHFVEQTVRFGSVFTVCGVRGTAVRIGSKEHGYNAVVWVCFSDAEGDRSHPVQLFLLLDAISNPHLYQDAERFRKMAREALDSLKDFPSDFKGGNQ